MITSSRFNIHLLFWSLEIFYSVKVSLYLLRWELSEGLVLSYDSNLDTVAFYLSFVTCWLLQGTQSMENQFFWSWGLEFIKFVFKVSSGRLGSCSNWISVELIIVSWRTSFKKMRAISINSSNKKTHSIRSFGRLLSFDLRFYILMEILSAILKMSLFKGWLFPYVSL